jgi:NodT family efflux transporter outer membrane factor (OMF) lipoprotein
VGYARADEFPTIDVGPGITTLRESPNQPYFPSLNSQATGDFVLPVDLSYEIDLWGRIRRSVTAAGETAQASAADLESISLSLHAELAVDYFELRSADAQQRLLDETVKAYRDSLELTRARLEGGVSPESDVAQAKVQLDTARVQATDIAVRRAQYEHAIAVLLGKPPASFELPPAPLDSRPPVIPIGIPSELLERRPDIAAAERTMQQENALIGAAEAAWFPDISLSAALEYIGPIPLPFSMARSIASAGASATQTVFNGGLTSAQVDAARAAYWQSVATYRQTVLTAFQQVEDQLAAIHYLTQQLAQERRAVADQRKAVDVFLNQFQAGTAAFTTVVVAEVQLLADQEAELTVRQDLYLASVSLIQGLGGGWDSVLLPTPVALQKGFSFLPKYESQPSPDSSIPSDVLVPPPPNAQPGAQPAPQ